MLIGLSLALSSTAIVIEHLSQKRRINTVMGRASFSILLFQDLAVVPILLLVGVLGYKPGENTIVGAVLALALAAAGIVAIVVLGRILLRPLFRLVRGHREFRAVRGGDLARRHRHGRAFGVVGISMRPRRVHGRTAARRDGVPQAIEATIEPFKGLLLGVFFISIGMKIDLVALVSEPLYVFACALGWSRSRRRSSRRLPRAPASPGRPRCIWACCSAPAASSRSSSSGLPWRPVS